MIRGHLEASLFEQVRFVHEKDKMSRSKPIRFCMHLLTGVFVLSGAITVLEASAFGQAEPVRTDLRRENDIEIETDLLPVSEYQRRLRRDLRVSVHQHQWLGGRRGVELQGRFW